MARRSSEELVPRNGRTLRVLIVARISGCASQKEMSLEDQIDNAKEAVADIYSDDVEFTVISTKGKGEALNRPELERIEAAYRSREYDLAVLDELSRLIRGGEAVRFLGIGVDYGTRSICLQDGVDTADGTWEEDALDASSENVAGQNRTSRRLKTKLMNRFRKHGGAPGRPIAGYIVPKGAKTYDDWRKDETATPIIAEAVERLLNRPDRRKKPNCSAIAAYFNQIGFPVGPYARRKTWNGPMVRRFLGNTLLKGFARRGTKHSVKNFETGRRRSQKNPNGPKFYEVPHLAHLQTDVFDMLQAELDSTTLGLAGRP